MFRLSVTLTEEVDPEVLAEAQKNTLLRFPSFSCRLKKGFFWYYLEHMDGAPPVVKDEYNPLQVLNERQNRHFMYRLLYSDKRIAVEYFHALTDGTGGMTFLLSLTAEYLRLKYGADVEVSQYIKDVHETPDAEECEDSFLRYTRKETTSRSEPASYQTNGTEVPFNKLLIVRASVSTDELCALAKKYNVTVGVFTTALLLYSSYRTQQTEKSRRKRNKIVKISVPVNLRRFFPSKTVRNFSAYVNPGILPRLGEYTFEEVLCQVEHFMGMNITEKELCARFSGNVAAERNPIVRVIPLVLKIPVLRTAFRLQGDRYYATTISNFGVIKLPEKTGEYIDRIDFLLGRAATRRTNCAVISYGGKTVFNFTRTQLETDTERYFLSSLVKMGVHVFVESNG